MVDLNRLLPAGSGWFLSDAHGLDETGHIVGDGIDDGRQRAYLLTLCRFRRNPSRRNRTIS